MGQSQMKILHVSYAFPPDQPGGTELYVEALCRELDTIGITSVVAAPASADASYTHKGIPVRRFGIRQGHLTVDDLYGDGDVRAAEAFGKILDEERPDILHQHALTMACSGRLITLAKQRNIPVVFTYHTPTVSCQRGSLLEWGQRPCDGRASVSRCTPCTLHGLGLDGASSSLVARTPEVAGNLIGRAGLGGGAWTALRMRGLMRHRIEHLQHVLTTVDTFVAPSPWVKTLLQQNGVPVARISLSPHGVSSTAAQPASAIPRSGREPLRLVHLGRLDPLKGTHVVIEAIRAIPHAYLRLDVLAVAQNAGDVERLASLQKLAAADDRVRFLPPVPQEQVISTLGAYDMVVVPSQTFETGPLVVLEAFAARVPVIGSALGGIAEKVSHGGNGWLVKPHDSIAAWSSALSRCASDGYLMSRLRAGVRRPRTMAEVATDMREVYQAQRISRGKREASTPVKRAHLTLVTGRRPAVSE